MNDQRISICFVIDSLSTAGTEYHLLNLIKYLDRNTFSPFLCLLDGSSEDSISLEQPNCPTLRLGVKKLINRNTIKAGYKFNRYLRQNNIQIVQAYFPDSLSLAMVFCRFSGVKKVIRNRRSLGYRLTKKELLIGKCISLTSIKTVANSSACKQSIIEQENAKPGSVVVINNGIQLSNLQSIKITSPSAQSPTVGILANLRPVKDHQTLLSAMLKLNKEFPAIRLSIAGDGPLYTQIAESIKKSGKQDDYKVLGKVSNVSKWIQSVDIAVLTSTSEGLSNSLIEYMAAGRPIVATAVGGNLELIEHEVNGLLVQPGNSDQLCEAIKRFLIDHDLALRCATKARQSAIEKFSVELQTRRFESFWLDLLEY